jgi:hypothetical protein
MKMWDADMPYHEVVVKYDACRLTGWSYFSTCYTACAAGQYTVSGSCVTKDSPATTPSEWNVQFKFDS